MSFTVWFTYPLFFCRDLNHKNLVKLIGVSVGKPIFIVTEFCGKVSAKFIFLSMWFKPTFSNQVYILLNNETRIETVVNFSVDSISREV